MRLREKQSEFAYKIAMLIKYINEQGYEVTFGDAWAHPEDNRHKKHSNHYIRLAIDLNLFKDGKYLTETKDHEQFGEYWENKLGGVWGGHYDDGNHYEY